MNKTRLFMLVGVILLTLALVGMALAADNAQKPNPPVQVAFTGLPPSGTGVDSLSGSYVAFDPSGGGDTCFIPGASQTFCFRAESYTGDWGYVYNLWEKFPTDWTVTNAYVQGTPVCDAGTWGDFSWSFQTDPYEVNVSHPRYQATTDHCVATYCFEVVAGTGTPDAEESWYWAGDNYGAPPYHPCSSDVYTPDGQAVCDESVNPQAEIPVCNLEPGLYLTPPTTQAQGCNGIPQVHDLSLFNNTGAPGTFDMTYSAPPGMATLTGPAQITAADGESVPFEVTLTPNVCNFDPIVATVDAEGNGYDDTATITKEIVNVPSFETVPASAPTWAGAGYPRDGCTAQNAAGEWVSYQIGDMSSYSGFWGYNTETNTWFQVGAANTPADRWAPDWAYDPDTNLCYVTGGATAPGGGNLTDTFVFDPVANAFTQLGNFTSMRDFHNSWVGTIDGTEYLCLGGGVNSSSIMVQSTQCYDLAQSAPGVWNAENAQIAAFPTDPFGAADGILHAPTGDQFWFVGGAVQAGAILSDEARYWDDADNTWHQAGNTGFPRYRVEGDFFNGDFYQLGGSSGGFTPTGEVVQGHFDGANWIWTLMDNLANIRMDNVMGVTDSSVWSIDGYGATSAAYVEHAVFCPLCTGPLQAEKTATPVIVPGDPIDYSITVNNTSDAEVDATLFDAIPAGTSFVPGSLTCDSGECSFDAGQNAVLWSGTLSGAVADGGGSNVDSLTGSYITFDPTLGGATCNVEGATQTFCFRADSFSPDFEYVYNAWLAFPTDWTVSNAYVVGTPFCDNGSWGSFSWSFEFAPNEININHPRYQGSGGASCTATYCVDVTTGDTESDASWYWDGDGYASPPHNPCSEDGYTPASMSAQPCDEAVNPVAEVPTCGPTSAVTIDFQVATDGLACPSVVTNSAVVSSEGNPDVLATADTNVYCTLEPVIVVSPLSLFAEQPPDTVTSQQLQICNEGVSPLDWSITEVPGMKVTSVTPAISSKQPFAINKPANVTRDPAVVFTPTKPTSEILLDQVPNQVNGIFVDAGCDICAGAQTLADNFALEATTTLEQIVMWSGYFSTDTPIDPDHIRVLIHQDAAGLPGTVVFDESDVAYTRVQTGVILFGVHEWMHTLTLSPFATLPPGNYWLEIFNDTGFGTDDFFWETGNVDTMGRGLFDAAWAVEAPGVNWIFPNGYEQALQIIGTIAPVEDIPWLSEAPTEGTVDPFACIFVDVSFDSAGLAAGSYTGELDVNSNDPVTPLVPIDVTLNVLEVADIDVTPTSLSSSQPPDEQVVQTLNIGNTGNGELVWNIFEFNAPLSLANPVSPLQSSGANGNSLSQENSFRVATPSVILKNSDTNLLALINDGSFENGPPPGSAWTEVTDQPCEWIGDWSSVWGVPAFDGLYDYWAGGYCGGIPTTSHVSQASIAVPAGSATLSFWYISYRPDADDGGDYAYISVNGTTVWTLDLIQANDTYPNFVNATVDLSAYAGQNVTLEFGAVSGGASTGNIRFDFIEWLVSETCTSPSDIPWLSEAPTDGVTPGGGSTPVAVTFDSTGLAAGDYAANLCVASNDLDEPLVIVPVDMTVLAPDIVVTPPSLDLALFPNETGTLNFTIENVGGADLDWSATEGATWLSLLPTSGTLLPGESVDVVATFDSAGLLPDVYTTDIDIASNDPDTPEVLLPTTLTVNGLDADLAIEKSASSDAVRVGDTITYTLEVSNTGPADAIGVTVVDTLPGLVTFVSASTGCVEAAGVVTCAVGDLAAEASTTLTIVVTANGEGVAVNTAVVSSDFVSDPDLTNNTSSVDVTISPAFYYFFLPIIQKS